eukprot:Gb_18040 [translate_table: standard]
MLGLLSNCECNKIEFLDLECTIIELPPINMKLNLVCNMFLTEKGDLIEEVEDIGIDVYSIEEDRQKTEQDNKLKMALDRKEKVKVSITKLRSALATLLKENNEQNPSERLQEKEFEIDPNLRSMVDDEINKTMEIARKELQWECEKKNIGLSKLRRYFLDSLEVERIVLHAFQNGTKVNNFRTAKISPDLKVAISEAKLPNEKLKQPKVSILSLVQQLNLGSDGTRFEDKSLEFPSLFKWLSFQYLGYVYSANISFDSGLAIFIFIPLVVAQDYFLVAFGLHLSLGRLFQIVEL